SRLPRAVTPGGSVVVLGIGSRPLTFPPHDLVDRRIAVVGSPSGSSKAARSLLDLASRSERRPEVTVMPFTEVLSALTLVRTGSVAGRVVLEMSST
ncbi:MAG: hypothetical protein ACRDYD_10225, partial [Acidimicrobiales bacterium]